MADYESIINDIAQAVKDKGGGTDPGRIREAKIKIQNLAYDKDNHKHLKKFIESKHYEKLADKIGLTDKTLVKNLIPTIQSSIAAFDQLGEHIRDAASATKDFAYSVAKGEGTFSSYTDTFAGKFSIVGDTIAGVGKRLDTNIEMFRQLSQTGANFGQSLIQLRTAAAASALPLDDFAALVQNNSRTLAALSGSTTQGAKFVTELGNALRTEAIPKLATLGFTVDEINETLLLDLDRQRRMGILNRGATNFNIDSAIRFGKQLDRLAKLTGIQRDELRKQIESQQSNAKFAAFMQGQTKETADRLQGFAGVIGEVSPGLNEGMQDLIANAGRPVTDAAIALIQNIPEAQGVVQDLISGQISTETALVRMRNAATGSIDRFRTATVTGQVEFLNLQGDVINLARRLLDVNEVLGETGPAAEKLTQGLTQFEDASKRLGSATQSLETAFMSAMGNLVGDASGAVGTGMTGLSKTLLGLPPLMAATMYGSMKLLQGGIALLKNTTPTFLAVYGGVKAGMATVGGKGGGLMQMLGAGKKSFGGTMKSGFGMKGMGLGSKFMRGTGIIGTGLGVLNAGANLMDDDKTNNAGAYGTLIGTALGIPFGPVGMMIGGMIGQVAGDKLFGGKKAFGGPTTAGQMNLVGERGPELRMEGVNSSIIASNNLKEIFDLKETNKLLTNLAKTTVEANGVTGQMLTALNTSNMINNKTRIATENTARQDRNRLVSS